MTKKLLLALIMSQRLPDTGQTLDQIELKVKEGERPLITSPAHKSNGKGMGK